MQIFYDGQVYAGQIAGGINRYFGNIIDRLPSDFQPTLTAPYRKNRLHYPQHPQLKLKQYIDFHPHRVSNRIRPRYFRWLTDLTPFDIFHPTYYNQLAERPLAQIPKSKAVVITVYDMIHELFESIEPSGITKTLKQAAILRADAIICISESTKRDLLHYYPQTEDRISVTPLASEFGPHLITHPAPLPDRPYFLYVGGRTQAYKGFDILLQAFAQIISTNSDLGLCVVGAPFNSSELDLIASLNLTAYIHHYSYPTDNHLAQLYRSSIAFVYPSLYEGFGIPPLEAMACGTPVIATNTSSIPEVIGDAGMLFEPKAHSDLAEMMLHLLNSPSDRDRLIAKGHERCQQFSWDVTARRTVEVYRSLH